MATPIGGPPVQDVPPPGGYPKVRRVVSVGVCSYTYMCTHTGEGHNHREGSPPRHTPPHQIFYKERLAPRGPPSWAIWGGTILVVAYGFIQVRRVSVCMCASIRSNLYTQSPATQHLNQPNQPNLRPIDTRWGGPTMSGATGRTRSGSRSWRLSRCCRRTRTCAGSGACVHTREACPGAAVGLDATPD